MGMEKPGWRADLLEVGREVMILEGNKYHRGVVVDVVGAVRRFPPIHGTSSQHGRSVGCERKGGDGVRKLEVVPIDGEANVLLATGHVRVVRWVEHGRERNCHEKILRVQREEEKKKKKRATKKRGGDSNI